MHGTRLPDSFLYEDHRFWIVHCSYTERTGPCVVHSAPCKSQSCISVDTRRGKKHSAHGTVNQTSTTFGKFVEHNIKKLISYYCRYTVTLCFILTQQMLSTCDDLPGSCLTWENPPDVWLRKEGSQYFLVPSVLWLTWATLSYLHLLVLSGEIRPKQGKNNRQQTKADALLCIFILIKRIALEKLPSEDGYKASAFHKRAVNFVSVCCRLHINHTKRKWLRGVWPLAQDQSSQWGVFDQTQLTRQTLLCEHWHKQWGVSLCHFITSQCRNKK